MRPLYIPNEDHTLGYGGNKIFKPIRTISNEVDSKAIENRVHDLHDNEMWLHVSKINHTINMATNAYFDKLGSLFVLLPLTTRMISSPGALYGKEHLNYTQDTVPIKLKWFDLEKEIFLSESSQIYLELYLTMKNVDSVYAIYNSFRKEHADATHLPEFHHLEYEGKVSQKENKKVILNLVREVIKKLIINNQDDLSFFLFDDDIDYLKDFSKRKKVTELTFEQALDVLYRSTKDQKYKEFTGKYFGSWEEVKLTSELDDMVMVSEFPLYEIAFYHAPIKRGNNLVGDNTDFIWPYYREFVGSGHRVRTLKELLEKAKKFNLPINDYKNYLISRELEDYVETSGFGVGWERLLQGLLKTPYIQTASAFPRSHNTLVP